LTGPRLASVLSLFALLLDSPITTAAGPRLQSMKQLRFHDIQRQTLDYSCGAAALAILLKRYLGEPVEETQILANIVLRLSQAEVRERVQEGFSMLDLKSSARHLGYSAEGVRLPPEALHALDGPVIILLRRNRLNPFVVLKGVEQGHAFLADPARGHQRLPLFELLNEWHGETLIVGHAEGRQPEPHSLSLPGAHYMVPENDVVRTLLGQSSR